MAYADPQSVTISGTAVSLKRTGLSLDKGEFRSVDGQTRLEIAHTSTGRRNRHLAKVLSEAIVSDPFVPAQNIPVGFSVHLVVDSPKQGVTAAQLAALSKALVVWATDANLASLIAGES